jgi:hypothetical protein
MTDDVTLHEIPRTRTIHVTVDIDTETSRLAVWKEGIGWVEIVTADLWAEATVALRQENERLTRIESAARVFLDTIPGPLGTRFSAAEVRRSELRASLERRL